MVVIAGVVFSPIGHGLRVLLGRRRQMLAGRGIASPTAFAPPPMLEDHPSIAVLPFTNISDDREQEFLADGMTEDVITGLSLSRSLFVIARNSTFSYKGKAPNIRDVGREMGVRYVLEGSVRRIGESLRVTAQLVDARNGVHVWAQALDRPLAEIFEIQDEITAGIVAALTAHLTHAVTPEVARARPDSLDAWQLCHRARAHFLSNFDAASRRTAEVLLRRAIRKDPKYAVAWVYLGCIVAWRWIVEPGTDANENREEARYCIERGVSLAAGDPDVLAFQGNFAIITGQPRDAVPYLEQALHLNPNEVVYRMFLARALAYVGRPAEALGEMEAVLRLSPRDPLAPNYAFQMAQIHFSLGSYAEAESWARRSLAGNARSSRVALILGEALAAEGRVEEAHEAIREALRITPEISLASQEYILRNLGLDEALLADRLRYLAIAWPLDLN